MPIFYFDVNDGSHTTRDSAGADLGNLHEAKASALLVARKLLNYETTKNIASHVFEIRDLSGTIVGRVPFFDALTEPGLAPALGHGAPLKQD